MWSWVAEDSFLHFPKASGMELMRASPRQSDMIIVAGRLSRKMAPVIRRIYDQMPEPKWVVAMGDCASSSGVFNNYALVQGADEVLPVDVYVSGCPPRPEALMFGILKLHERIKAEGIAEGLNAAGIRTAWNKEIIALIAYLQRLGTDIRTD